MRIPWRLVVVEATAVWAATRLMLVAVAYLTVSLTGSARGRLGRTLLESWSQWDAHWYLLISRLGYFDPRTANFFPLYPKTVAALAVVFGAAHGPVWPALDVLRLGIALAVSNLAALAAFIGIAALAWQELRSQAAVRATLLVAAAYPLAFILAAPYAESLFVAFAAFSLFFARREAWPQAAVCAALAALTRPLAVVLVLPLLVELWRGHRGRPLGLGSAASAAATLAAVPVGFGIYMAYLWRRFGDPLLFVHTQLRYWHHSFRPPWETLARVLAAIVHQRGTPQGAMALVDLAAIAGAVLITLALGRGRPLSFALYTLGLASLTILSPSLGIPDAIEAASRYLVAAVPLWLLVAQWSGGHRRAAGPMLGAAFMLQAVICAAFLSGRAGVF